MSGHAREPGSFRDARAKVFYADGEVLRGLSPEALKEWEALSATAFFRRFRDEGRIVATERLDAEEVSRRGLPREWAAILRHERIPFVSYPYEWPFEMLRDAALGQLELMRAALAEGMLLKDASPFNTQFVGALPVFIDVVSIRRLEDGEPWPGYRQFCQMFLFPLLLWSYKGVRFQPWLRGRLEGIEPRELRNLMSWRDLLRPGVLRHVVLHAHLQQAFGAERRSVRTEIRNAGFHRELVVANVEGLVRLVRGLRPPRSASAWAGYGAGTYSPEDESAKTAFVRRAVERKRRRVVWDLGANTGRFARIAAGNAETVVAMDSDPVVVDALYGALRSENERRILPLVVDVADPPPALGWRGRERMPLQERGAPDLTLCLALLHHLNIGANLPLEEILEWLAGLGPSLVVEFVSKDDPMVQKLLANREDPDVAGDEQAFEACLGRWFRVVERQRLASGTRVLYEAERLP